MLQEQLSPAFLSAPVAFVHEQTPLPDVALHTIRVPSKYYADERQQVQLVVLQVHCDGLTAKVFPNGIFLPVLSLAEHPLHES